MKLLIFCLLLIPELILTISCTTLKRYSKAEQSGTENSLADIDLFGYTLSDAQPENGNKTLWDLSADAQSQFIKILNTRYPDNDKFLEALSFKYLMDEKPMFPGSYINKDLHMIFSVSRLRNTGDTDNPPGLKLSPADRIEYLKITLGIPDHQGVRFTGWNMFTTEYGTLDVADVSFSRSIEIDASALLTKEGKESGAELSAGGKSSASQREDQELKYRYLKLNGRINSNSVEMEEEGTRETDLTGNIMADIAIEFEKFPEIITDFEGLTDSTGRYNAPSCIGLKYSEVLVPAIEKIKDTLFADLKMDYIYRNVVSGQKTFPEWDDRVRYYNGSVSKRVPLFTSFDYVPGFYCIGIEKASPGRSILKLSAPGKKEYALIFRSDRKAADFLGWITDYFARSGNRNKPLVIGGYTLKFMEEDLAGEVPGEVFGLSVLPYYI
jgi:hypothetical protein